jgi:spore maturation protein CgeB
MKIAHISAPYPDYVSSFYHKQPELITQSYAQQKSQLDHDGFSWSDCWSNALTPLGYEVLEIYLNVEPLQRQWAKENNLSDALSISLEEILIKQLKLFKPDIVWFVNHNENLLKEISQTIPSIKLILGWCGSAIPRTKVWQYMNLILSCAPESVEKFRGLGLKSQHFNHAFDLRINSRLQLPAKFIEVCFIGQIIRANQFHLHRDKILEELISHSDLRIFSNSYNQSIKQNIKSLLKITAYESVKKLSQLDIFQGIFKKLTDFPSKPVMPVNYKLKPFVSPALFGLEMYQTLLNSKIVLNIHADSSPTHASNMRLFETTGVGACLLTDWKPNLPKLFEPDREVVTYRSVEECIEKVNWLLENPKQIELIAIAGQERTIKDHSFGQRAIQLDQIIRKELA